MADIIDDKHLDQHVEELKQLEKQKEDIRETTEELEYCINEMRRHTKEK